MCKPELIKSPAYIEPFLKEEYREMLIWTFLGKVNKCGDKFQTRKNDYSDFFKRNSIISNRGESMKILSRKGGAVFGRFQLVQLPFNLKL